MQGSERRKGYHKGDLFGVLFDQHKTLGNDRPARLERDSESASFFLGKRRGPEHSENHSAQFLPERFDLGGTVRATCLFLSLQLRPGL